MSYDGGISNDPLAVARSIIITDPGLCHHGNLNALHNMSCVRHTIPTHKETYALLKYTDIFTVYTG